MEVLQEARWTALEKAELAQQLRVEARSQQKPETGLEVLKLLCLLLWLVMSIASV